MKYQIQKKSIQQKIQKTYLKKFPKGFIIEQIRLFKENGVTHSLDLEIKEIKVQKIEGVIKKVRIESKPYMKQQ